MTMSRSKKRKRRPLGGAPVPKPSGVGTYLLGRLFVFNVLSALLVFLAGAVLLQRQESIPERIAALPGWLVGLFMAAWLLVTLYRFYLSLTQNPRLRHIAGDRRLLQKYARSQVVSTFASLFFVAVAVLYLSGILQPLVDVAVERIESVDPVAVSVAVSILGGVFWNIVGSALWDLIKVLYRRATSDSGKLATRSGRRTAGGRS